MGIIEMMKFDDGVNLTRGNWWMWTIGLFVVQIVVGIVLAIASRIYSNRFHASYRMDDVRSCCRKIKESRLYRTCRICIKNYYRSLGTY
jgi:hypothetical protein